MAEPRFLDIGHERQKSYYKSHQCQKNGVRQPRHELADNSHSTGQQQ